MKLESPRGTKDILPPESFLWSYIEEVFRNICYCYGYKEIRTPIFEFTELFTRGIGQTTDVVEKEMYTFLDRKGRSLTLRPEGTAGVVRAFIQNNLYRNPYTKLFYIGPIFRYERPQAGRYRQSHQIGIEAFGSNNPLIDVEVILLITNFYRDVGIKQFQILLNSIGCRECRKYYKEKLIEFAQKKIENFCLNCQQRLTKNPLRLLDCKQTSCREAIADAPKILDFLCKDCKEHFNTTVKLLNNAGVEVTIKPYLVRGLDYYTRTVFEVVSPLLGAQNSLCGGGRFDDLVELLGGPSTPAVGVAGGMERLLLALKEEKVKLHNIPSSIYIVASPEREENSLLLAERLRRKSSYPVEITYGRDIREKLKIVNKLTGRWVILLTSEEEIYNQVIIKDMLSGEQWKAFEGEILKTIKEKEKEKWN